MTDRNIFRKFKKETLIDMLEDAAKNWLAHDGLWFQATERNFGMDAAVKLDAEAWSHFTVIEANRIMRRHNINKGGGLQALERALNLRLYALINEQSMTWVNEHTLRFEMNQCRVQTTRQRKGLPDFPCKKVGIIEYTGFAHAIDPRIQTRCIACPPDPHPETFFCAWEFSIIDESM